MPVRIADMNHHRLVMFGAHFPGRIEARIVRLNVTAVLIPQFQPQDLVDLQPHRARPKTALQLRRCLRGPTGVVDAVEIQTREMNDALPVRGALGIAGTSPVGLIRM
jgi:hypothetical protein